MKKSAALIILNDRLQFLGLDGRWVDEYPEARIFHTLPAANAAARPLPIANVIARWGEENQLCVQTWRNGTVVMHREEGATL